MDRTAGCRSVIFGEPSLVSLDEIVAKRYDVVDGKFCGSVGVHHRRLVYGLAFFGNSRLDGKELNVDIGTVHGSQLFGKTSDMRGLYAESADKAGDLNARLGGQVVDKTGIYHVAADAVGRIGDNRFHYAGSIFVRALVREISLKRLTRLCPLLLVLFTAAGIFVKRDAVSLDKLRILALDKERIVLRVMFARLGNIITETAYVLKADKILEVIGRIVKYLKGAAADLGIEVNAVGILYLKEPCHMVDTCYLFGQRSGNVICHTDLFEKGLGADLNAVAQTHRAHAGVGSMYPASIAIGLV